MTALARKDINSLDRRNSTLSGKILDQWEQREWSDQDPDEPPAIEYTSALTALLDPENPELEIGSITLQAHHKPALEAILSLGDYIHKNPNAPVPSPSAPIPADIIVYLQIAQENHMGDYQNLIANLQK